MAKKNLKIHSENILPIIKKWLYSDKDIFIRELVSNACDAISKLLILKERGEASPLENESPSIQIQIDKEKKTLTFTDNGIGMDAEEVEKYIAQLAFSGAEEFLAKYKSDKQEDQIIGHFGLGFYSAYMVAEHVDIQTLSYKEGAEAVSWSCDGSSEYEQEKGIRERRGTEIVLHLAPGEEEYLEASRIDEILKRYCAFLPYPITLNDSCINETPPLWMKPSMEATDKEYIDFYHKLYPMEPDPLFWIHLNVDYPFNLKGILYFPKISKDVDLKKETIRLFCNRVFVSNHCNDILPDYLTILRGAIDSPDIPLNVSRSSLQMDRTVKQLGSHISKKISDKLTSLYTTDREKFLTYWEDIELIIKYGALQDEKFYERIKDFLVFKTNQEGYSTITEYLERNKEKMGNTIYYAHPEHADGHFFNLFREKGIEVLFTRPMMIDNALISSLEHKQSVKFKRIDADLGEALLDPERERTLLDAEGKTERIRMAEFFKSKLNFTEIDVEAKSIASESLPALLVIEEQQRRLRETLSYHGRGEIPDIVKPKFVINTNSKLIQSIYAMELKNPALAKDLANHVYDTARLAQRELSPSQLNEYIARSNEILSQLST